jgi:hypothetical protein
VTLDVNLRVYRTMQKFAGFRVIVF